MSVEDVVHKLTRHLQNKKLFKEDAPWTLKDSPLGGRGLFANRDINPGELVLIDWYLMIGPRSGEIREPTCVVCCSKSSQLHPCTSGCGLPVCSANCQGSASHAEECLLIKHWRQEVCLNEWSLELLRALAPIRGLLLSEEEKDLVRVMAANDLSKCFEVDLLKNRFKCNLSEAEEKFLRYVCAVYDTNGFECVVSCGDDQSMGFSSLRALYPLAAMLNHNCVPNTMHVFDNKQRMYLLTTLPIRKDEEIFASYTSFFWATPTRRHHLKLTKQFWCKCARCNDRSEFGTKLCALNCVECDGFLLPEETLNGNEKWKCETCEKYVNKKTVGVVQSMLGSMVGSVATAELSDLLIFLRKRMKRFAPPFNQIAIELKCQATWLLGNKEGFLWNELTEDDLLYKEGLCRELLQILNDLKAGQCKARGLFLYELCETLTEMSKRHQGNGRKNDFDKEAAAYMDEAAFILKYDISAPAKVFQYCEQKYGKSRWASVIP